MDPSNETGAPPPSGEREEADSKSFVDGLISRGEAVVVPEGAPMPPGATHEIVGRTDNGEPVVRRKRFSAF